MKNIISILCITSFCIALSSCNKNDENTNIPAKSTCKIMKYESDESGGYIVNYIYATNGNLLSMQASVQTQSRLYTYKYDLKNRISYEKRNNNDTVFYYYDDNNLLTSAIFKATSGTYDTSVFEYNNNRQLIKRYFRISPFGWNTTYEWGEEGNVLTERNYNTENELINTTTFEYDSQHNWNLTDTRPLWEPKNVNNTKTIYSSGIIHQTYNYTHYNSKGFPTEYTLIRSNGDTINVTLTYECP